MINLFKTQKIAFIMSRRLGDTLLSMVIVNNLFRNGFDVVVYGDYLVELKNWFPWIKIFPLPSSRQAQDIFVSYDVLLHAYSVDIIGEANKWHPKVIVLDDFATYRLGISMVDIQVAICRKELGLVNLTRDNGLIVPATLIHRKNNKRVVIHPTSYEIKKNWLPKRFLQLTYWLQQQGFQPEWIVSQKERKDWLWVKEKNILLPEFKSLDEVARWLYESGWFVGNDSGIGHLASNLNIPTVTLSMRPGIARRWRPTWSAGEVVLPPSWLITKPLKERFWKFLISVNRVEQAFKQLTQRLGIVEIHQ